MEKKVLVTATTFPRWKGDTEPGFVFNLSKFLAKKGYKIIVLVPHYYKAKKYEIMDKLKVYRFTYFLPRKLQKVCYEGGILPNIRKSFIAKIQFPFFLFFETINTIKIIKRDKIDLMHAHWIMPQGFIAFLMKKIYGVPYVVTAHAGDIFPLKSKLLRSFARLSLDNSDFCTVNSYYTKKAVLDISKIKNIEIIPMGVDLNLFRKRKKRSKLREELGIKKELILTVGRLVEKKGIKYLINAMPRVIKEFPESKLVIIGDGPERKNLENLVKSLELRKYVMFLGKIKNEYLPRYYEAADVFVGPSIITKSGDTEGLGIVFLEAIASGTCVIGSNIGGIPDIIKHGKTGLLVKQKEPNSISTSVIKILKNNKLRQILIKNALTHIRNTYDWNIVAEKFDKILLKLSKQ